MEAMEFYTPEYLFCEIVPKDGTAHDHRVWIYCPKALSLIEFVAMDALGIEIDVFDKERKAGEFVHLERFHAYWTQNNCDFAGQDEQEIVQGAWEYFLRYMKWEDSQLNDDAIQ